MMTVGEVTDLMFDMFLLAIQLGGPILITSMLVGVIISILQAATQIHEQTITFVPKLIVVGLVLIITGSTMLQTLQDFMKEIFVLMAG